MLVHEFAKKYKFKGSDSKIARKVYGDTDMTEQQWFDKLKKEYDFKDETSLRKVREAKQKKSTKKKSASKSTKKNSED